MKKLLIAGCALVILAGMAEAKERLVKCDLRPDGAYRGTPPEVVIVYDKGAKKMVVFDSFLKAFDRKPVYGRVGRDDDKTFVLRWKVDDVKSDNGQVMDWRFSLNWTRTNGQAKISGRAAVSDDNNYGSGSCKFIK